MKLHAKTPFVQSDVKRHLLSGKLTMRGAEVKFGSDGSWIDLHTDSGVQRVPVRVKGKTFGPSIQKTDASLVVMQYWRREMRTSAEQKHPTPLRCGGTAARRDSSDAARARSPRPCSSLAGLATVEAIADSRVAATLKTSEVEGAWRTRMGHEGSDVASTRPRRGKTRAPETGRGMAGKSCQRARRSRRTRRNSMCHELQTNPQVRNEHAMKSHSCRINRGLRGA